MDDNEKFVRDNWMWVFTFKGKNDSIPVEVLKELVQTTLAELKRGMKETPCK